jgi:outer membrane receptor protein involved in Fe transport
MLCFAAATAAMAEDGGVSSNDGSAADSRAKDAAAPDHPRSTAASVADAGHVPLPDDADDEILSVIASIHDITELSLEDLLNAESTASTKSRALNLRDSPNVMTLVTREEIQRSGARELADVLKLVPGISFGVDMYSSVYAGFRGIWGSEGKILLLFDGHPMSELLYYDTELGNRIPVDQIERIEIVRGPGSVIYGDSAELLVINVITRSAKDLEGVAVTGMYGQMLDGAIHHGQSLSSTFGHRTLSAMVGKTIGGKGGKDDNDGLALKAGVYVGQGTRSDQPYTDMTGATYNFAGGEARNDPLLLHVSADYRGLKVGYLFEDYHTTMKDGYGESIADALPVDYIASSLNISYEWRPSTAIKVVPRFSWLYQKPWRTASDTARLNYGDSYYWNPTAQRALGGVLLIWDVIRPLDLLLGSDYYVDSATDRIDGFLDPNGPAEPDPNNPLPKVQSVSYRDATVYGQALLDTPWVNLSAGARYEHRQHVGGSFVPRAGVTKIWGPAHFKLLYNRAFRTPSMGNLSHNLDVSAETTTVAEAEVGYRLHPTLFVVASGFDISIDKPFVYFYDNARNVETYRNFGPMGTRGAELELRFKSERTFANASYSYYTTAGKDRIDALFVPGHAHVLLGFSPHKFALLAGTGIGKRIDASLSALLLAGPHFGYYAYDATGTPMARDFGAELQLNAFVSYRDLLLPGSTIGLGIYNLTNAKTMMIQPSNNGHSPMPGPSREILLRIGYERLGGPKLHLQ